MAACSRAALLRYIAVGASGLLVGCLMALYQLLLSDVIDMLWTVCALQMLTPAVSVLVVPPCVLLLAAGLMRALPHGHLRLYVQMTSKGEHADVWRGVVGTVLVSIVTIASGGSAGPEGPVLAIGASISVAVHEIVLRRRLSAAPEGPEGAESVLTSVQAVAMIGGCCALAATLDHPIKGCVMGMELPHLYGSIKRGDVLPYALAASCLSFGAHRMLMRPFSIESVPMLPPTACTLSHVPLAVPLGVLAGILSLLFVRAKEALDRLPYPTVPRALVLGFIVGFIALVLPETLMYGEHRLGILASEYGEQDGQAFVNALSPEYSASLGVAKLCSVVLTITAAYPGGIVYGLLFSGYMLGPRTWQLATHALPALVTLDDISALDYVGPPSPRGITAEICAQALGSALLGGVLRVPLGATLVVGMSSGASETMLALLLITNFVAVAVNPYSPAGQPDS